MTYFHPEIGVRDTGRRADKRAQQDVDRTL